MPFFQVASSYVEGFSLYGDAAGIEWPFELLELDDDAVARATRGRPARRSVVHPPDRTDVLPPPLRPFVSEMTDYPPGGAAMRPVHHGGSRPFLVHEFVTSVVEGHPSRVDAPTAGAWTAPGVCAHDSALRGGTPVAVPTY